MKSETSKLLDELESDLERLKADALRSDYNAIKSKMTITSAAIKDLSEHAPEDIAFKKRIATLLEVYKEIILILETHKHQVSGQLTKIASARKIVDVYGANNNSF